MKTNTIKAISTVALGLLFQVAQAGNITDINVSVLPNKQRVIKVRFDQGAVEPTGFITAAPAKIALDFAGTDVKLAQNSLSFNDTLLNQIVAAQGNGYTRVLLGLAKEGQYNTQVKGNEVWIYVREAVSTNTAPVHNNVQAAAQTVASPAPASYQSSSSSYPFSVDFHKGSSNTGVFEFSSNYQEKPVVKTQSDRLVITLRNYPLSTRDQRNLDVTDFSTAVRTIAVRRVGNDTQITIRNQGAWSHKLTQNGGRFSVQIAPSTGIAEEGMGGLRDKTKQKFTGKNITLDFQDVDVRTILQIIAKEANMNIIASDSVQGKMTLSVKDVPWDQALDLVLDARNLEMRRNGNIINIAPRAELLAKDKAELTALKEVQDLGPLYTRSYQLKYKNVEEFKNILKLEERGNSTNNNTLLSGRGSAMIDPSTNTLIITDNQSVIKKMDRLVEELDVPARQVMVEARIVEAQEGFSRALGVQFGVRREGHTAINNTMSNASTNGALEPNIALPVTSSTTGTIGIVHAIKSTVLGLELNASESDNRLKTISTPRVLTQDRKEAEIRQGTQIPYTTRDREGATTTAFKDAMLSLKVTPRITPDNKIILDVTVTKDAADYSHITSEGEPGIDTKYMKTQAMIEDGGTLIVGGIYQEIMGNNLIKVPLLGDIPILGNLFRSRSRSHSRNELLFFITPRIMGNESSVMRY